MRQLTLHVDRSTPIDVDTYWGFEVIRYKNKIISKKWSLFGAVHSFEAIEDGQTVKYEVRFFVKYPSKYTTAFDIKRNNEPLLEM